jgi:hypothetical protein
LYSRHSICSPFRELVIRFTDISTHLSPPPYPKSHHLRCQPPTLSALAANPSNERLHLISHASPAHEFFNYLLNKIIEQQKVMFASNLLQLPFAMEEALKFGSKKV